MKPIGKYEVIAEIGAGSMGTIYRARDQVLDRAVALKVLRTDADLEPELKERFYREARACARLAHPGIITVYDLGEADGAVYIAMELLTGSDLRRLLLENRLPPLQAKLDLMVQVCEALDHAHRQQLVHRDIKPSNIFLCDDQRAKVLDFGIARLPTSNLTIAGRVLGSPNYMAPEQIRGGKCDSRSDLFSAAIVFYELLVRAHPFQDEFIPRRIVAGPPDALRAKDPQIPEEVEALLMRVLEKDPDKRIQTGGEFAAGLRAALENLRGGQSSTASVMAPAPPLAATPIPTRSQGEDTAEQRVSEFLRVVGDFDDGIDQRNSQAAGAALERMRRIAAIDSRFLVAVSDCEARMRHMAAAEAPPPPPPSPPTSPQPQQAGAANGAATAAPGIRTVPQPAQPENVEPAALPEPARPAPPSPRNRMLVAVAAVVVFLIAAAAVVRMGKNRTPQIPDPPTLPALATAMVGATSADLLATSSASGQRLAVLQRGESVNVTELPGSRDQEYIKVQAFGAGKPVGFVRTLALSNWSGESAEAVFFITRLSAPAETAGEAELNAQLERWNQFLTKFPAAPQGPEANLEAARLAVALAERRKSAGKPATEWQPYMNRAKESLARVTGSPALESEAAQLGRRLVGSGPPPVTATPEQILRGKVNSLWENGKYQQAMQLVDQILAAAPDHKEALLWKKKIRASQEAEAAAQ